MKSNHSPEITLLLMGCSLDVSTERKTQISQFIAQHPINWDRLYTLATRHRITPFLYQTLQPIPAIPESFLLTLKQDCRLAATGNLLKLHQYHLVSDLFRENAIQHLPLKGIYLAEHYYPDSSLRINGDIDVLINKEDVFKTITLLQANDYHLNQKHELHWRQGKQTILTDLFEVSLFKPFSTDSYFDIDLHWQIMGFNKDYLLFDLSYIRSEPAFSAEREVILLIVHHGVNNIWQQIYYINDLYFFLEKEDINWSWLMQELKQYGLERVFLAGVYWCWQIWDLTLPPFIQELVKSPGVYSLAESCANSWEADQPSEFSQLVVKQLHFFAKAQTNAGKQLKVYNTFLSSRLFRYSLFHVGKRLIYIPKEVGFITIFVRMIQSAIRFLPARRYQQK